MYIELNYYREDTGKWYSEGRTEIPIDWDKHWEAVEYVIRMLKEGKRPGLIDGFTFDVLVTYYTIHGTITGLLKRENL